MGPSEAREPETAGSLLFAASGRAQEYIYFGTPVPKECRLGEFQVRLMTMAVEPKLCLFSICYT